MINKETNQDGMDNKPVQRVNKNIIDNIDDGNDKYIDDEYYTDDYDDCDYGDNNDINEHDNGHVPSRRSWPLRIVAHSIGVFRSCCGYFLAYFASSTGGFGNAVAAVGERH
jgi:hypothetical protein